MRGLTDDDKRNGSPDPSQEEVTPARGVQIPRPPGPPPQQQYRPTPAMPQPYRQAPQVVYVPVDAQGRPYKPKPRKPVVTIFAALSLLLIIAALIYPRIETAMRNDARARSVATEQEAGIVRRIADDLPGRVTDVELSANRGTVELTVQVDDDLVDVFYAMGIKSMVELETGQRLDLFEVRLIGPTKVEGWRWTSLNPRQWVPKT